MPQTFVPPRPPRGFTLIELLVVMAILAVLGGLLVTAVMRASTRSKISTTQATLLNIKAAMDRYEQDFSDYPPSGADTTGMAGAELLYECLTTSKKGGPYADKDLTTVDSNNNGKPEFGDPWKKPIYYFHRDDYGRNNPNRKSYRLISGGPNGEYQSGESESDDIVNWDKSKPDQ